MVTRNFQVTVKFLQRIVCKQPWANCQPTVCSGQLSLLPSTGRKM